MNVIYNGATRKVTEILTTKNAGNVYVFEDGTTARADECHLKPSIHDAEERLEDLMEEFERAIRRYGVMRFCREAGVQHETVRRWFLRRSYPSLQTAVKAASITGAEFCLFDFEERL